MTKSQLRNKYRQLRKQLTDYQIDEKSIEIANQLLKMPIWELKTYHLFFPISKMNEVDTSYILSILHGKDKAVVLPKMEIESRDLKHILLTEETILKKNHLGITEPQNGQEVHPSTIDVVFVPLLAYDHKGNRVGYGGGYYDKFLSQCKAHTLKIGVSFFACEQEQIQDTLPTDIPLDYCVTPTQIFTF